MRKKAFLATLKAALEKAAPATRARTALESRDIEAWMGPADPAA